MGAERDLIGIPVIDVPFGATAEEIDASQKIVENVKNDEQAGLVMTAIGPNPQDRFVFRLVTGQGSGSRAVNTDRLIQRYSGEIASAALAHFLRGGNQDYRLTSDVRDLFQVAVKAWMGRIADVWNRQAIPNLLAMNGMSGKCFLQHGRITQLSLQSITNFMTAGVQNKFISVDRELENFLRHEAELPELAADKEPASEPEPVTRSGNPEAPPVPPVPPIPPKAKETPEPGDKGQEGGLNANPGQNQRGLFQTNSASGGLSKIKAASEVLDLLDDLDDDAVWERYERDVLQEFADAVHG